MAGKVSLIRWCLSRGLEEVRGNQVGIWENIPGKEKRFKGLKAEGSMVYLRSEGRGLGEKPGGGRSTQWVFQVAGST